jgi:hypothetical protein
MEVKSNRRGGNARNRRAKGAHERGRALERREEAKVRQEAYSKLTLDEKLAEQLAHQRAKIERGETDIKMGKQLAKLLALKK